MAAEMEVFLGLLGVLILLLLTVFAYVIYCGLFHAIQIDTRKPPFESLIIAYKFARGPYKDCGHLFTDIHFLVPHLQCIGIYYDNPREVTAENLRYLVGVIVGNKEMTASSEDQSLLQSKGYKFAKFPSVDHMVLTTFPFKGRLSIAIGVARVYPALCDYVKEKRLCAHPMIEIYRDSDILFCAPLSKQDEFYVSEASADVSEEVSQSQDDLSNDDKDELTTSAVSESVQGRTETEAENLSAEPTNGEVSDKSSASSFEELNFDK